MSATNRVVAGLGKELGRCRRRRRLTLAAAAAQAGVSLTLIADIEHGRCQPSLGTLGKLVRAYHIVVALKPDGFGILLLDEPTS